MMLLLIVCYLTSGEASEIIRENTMKDEETGAIISRYKQEQIIIMGDMNEHIGMLGERIHKNGELLLILSERYNLEIGNLTTAEGKVTRKRLTAIEKSAILYILYSQEGKGISIMKIDEAGEIDVKLDHNVITFRYEIGRRIYKKKKGNPEINM